MDRPYEHYALRVRSLDHERPVMHARDFDDWRGYSSGTRPTGILTARDRA